MSAAASDLIADFTDSSTSRTLPEPGSRAPAVVSMPSITPLLCAGLRCFGRPLLAASGGPGLSLVACCRAAPADAGMPLIEFPFILTGHPVYVNVFEMADISGHFDVFAGRRPVLLNGPTSRSEIKI
jgi:hypothetical protein